MDFVVSVLDVVNDVDVAYVFIVVNVVELVTVVNVVNVGNVLLRLFGRIRKREKEFNPREIEGDSDATRIGDLNDSEK